MQSPEAVELFRLYQRQLLFQILESTRDELKRFGVADSKLQEATEAVAFAAIWAFEQFDVTGPDFVPAHPLVAFTRTRDPKLVTGAGGTYMHELVPGATEEVFEGRKWNEP